MKTYPATPSAAAMLEARRSHLLETTENLGDPGLADSDTWSETIEQGQAAAAHNTLEALRHLLDQAQQDVERALDRLETGDYGICEDCSQPIPPERLHVLPEASRCVRCQRRHTNDPRIKSCA